jgi:hypothetical protein
MKKQNLPQQTHFIGVLTLEDITLTLEDFRWEAAVSLEI